MINTNGQLLNPVFICLQEPSGRLPVKKEIFSATNTVISCSTSGKLNKSLVEYWIREVLDKVVNNRFLLLVNQWSPHADINAYEDNQTKGQSSKLLLIPKRTTSN
jgi:hypothetical protein